MRHFVSSILLHISFTPPQGVPVSLAPRLMSCQELGQLLWGQAVTGVAPAQATGCFPLCFRLHIDFHRFRSRWGGGWEGADGLSGSCVSIQGNRIDAAACA
jgi:hypothetical protein